MPVGEEEQPKHRIQMRLIMRWSPMRSVFSIEPEGMSSAPGPIVPLMRRKGRPHPEPGDDFSFYALGLHGELGLFEGGFAQEALPTSLPVSLLIGFCSTSQPSRSTTTGLSDKCVVRCVSRSWHLEAVPLLSANLQELHEIRWVDARITGRTKLAFGVIHRLAQGGQ